VGYSLRQLIKSIDIVYYTKTEKCISPPCDYINNIVFSKRNKGKRYYKSNTQKEKKIAFEEF